jgi:hypothetical protein
MRHAYYLFFLAPLLWASCNGHSGNSSPFGSSSSSSYEEHKLTLKEQEEQDPLRFLSSDGTYQPTLLGRWRLNGTISSSATVARYKDVMIEIKFYSETETLLGTSNHTFYEYFEPGSTKNFSFKVDGYPGTQKIGWSILSASIP